MHRLVPLVALLAGCDDYVVVKTYDATWDGTKALMADNCNSCHTDGPGVGVFPDDVLADICDDSYVYYVDPGHPENSVLWQALSPDPADRPDPLIAPMPLGSALHGDTTASIKRWIENGAEITDPCPGADTDTDIPDTDTDGAP
jgi:hypothetical protein